MEEEEAEEEVVVVVLDRCETEREGSKRGGEDVGGRERGLTCCIIGGAVTQ